MPRSGKDQLTGGTKDVNPHYRTVNFQRSLAAVGFSFGQGDQTSGTASLVDVFSIDTGIAQNVPAGRGGKQIIMELLGVHLKAGSNVDAQYALSPTFMDSVTFCSTAYTNGTHWATQDHIESLLCSTAPLQTSLPTGIMATQQQSSSNAVVGDVVTVDSGNPTILFKTGETKAAHYSYLPPQVAGYNYSLSSAFMVEDEHYERYIDLTDSAGHGLLVATQKLYFWAGSRYRADWETSASVTASGTLSVNTYAWNIELEYRWKEVPEAEYLQILIENTSVN